MTRSPPFVATTHPAFLVRGNARLTGLFQHALKRAVDVAEGAWAPRWSDAGLVRPKACSRTFLKTVQVKRDGEWTDVKKYRVSHVKKWSLQRMKDELGKLKWKRISFDIETDGVSVYGRKYLLDESRAEADAKSGEDKECEPTQLRCLGIFDGRRGVVVPFLWRRYLVNPATGELETRWESYWTPKERAALLKFLSAMFARCRQLRTQNGQFDRSLLRREGLRFGDEEDDRLAHVRHLDTLLSHHTVASYLPHDLGSLSSLYTEAPYYKATLEGESWSSDSDSELWLYCARDTKTTWLIAEELLGELGNAEYDAIGVNAQSHWQERRCEEWTRTGFKLDPQAVRFFRRDFARKRDLALSKLREMVPENAREGLSRIVAGERADDGEVFEAPAVDLSPTFNPGSLLQLRFVLAALGVPLREQTATGDISTDEEVLLGARKELVDQRVPAEDPRLRFLDLLLAWRAAAKVYGTYLSPLVSPIDGRLHPGFRIGPPTGRLASASPNIQNQPATIRGIYVADDDHVLVSGDWDALELRLAAVLSGDKVLLQAFADYDAGTGPKVHVVNMCNIFGLKMEPEKFGGDFIKAGEYLAEKMPGMYRAAKVFAYALIYGATQSTVFEKVREELPDMDERAFTVVFDRFVTVYHALMAFQESLATNGTRDHFVPTAVLGRRGYYFETPRWDGKSPEASEMQNFPYQGTAADLVGLANRRVYERVLVPWQKKLKPGERLEQLAQVHDELLFVVPKRLAEEFIAEVKRICEENPFAATRAIRLPVAYKASHRWKSIEVKCACGGSGKIDEGDVGACKKCKQPVSLAA